MPVTVSVKQWVNEYERVSVSHCSVICVSTYFKGENSGLSMCLTSKEKGEREINADQFCSEAPQDSSLPSRSCKVMLTGALLPQVRLQWEEEVGADGLLD